MLYRTPRLIGILTTVCLLALGTGLWTVAARPGIAHATEPTTNPARTLHSGNAAPASGPAGQRTGLMDVTGISARLGHSVALQRDGTAWAWGNNTGGQLGSEALSFGNSSVPLQVTGLDNVTFVAAGGDHSLAVTSDGTVWAWGTNNNGQLGDGTTIDRSAPVRVNGLTNVPGGVKAVAAGLQYSVALKNDGTVWAWGTNDVGQLGDGTTTNRTAPVQVSGLSGVTALVAGTGHALALKNDGSVWAWGANNMGQLGDSTTTDRSTPVQVTGGMANVRALAAGLVHSLAAKNDGTVWAWGGNEAGQLGDGTITNHSTPIQVGGGLTGVVSLAAGSYHSLAVKNDGTVWAWGSNGLGQLGDGTTTNHSLPIQVSGGMTATREVAAGDQYSLALKSDGSVWAWGSNQQGELGNGCLAGECRTQRTPVQVTAGIPSMGQ
jgi:alpha-tubulin suppressor-like RCC1 family protein